MRTTRLRHPASLAATCALALAIAGLPACAPDPLEPGTSTSLGDQIIGEWGLVRASGGAAGTDERYEVTASPDVVQFRRDRTYRRFLPDTTLEGDYWVRDVLRRGGDTLEFEFGLESQAAFGPARYWLIDGARLQTVPGRCDRVCLWFERR